MVDYTSGGITARTTETAEREDLIIQTNHFGRPLTMKSTWYHILMLVMLYTVEI